MIRSRIQCFHNRMPFVFLTMMFAFVLSSFLVRAASPETQDQALEPSSVASEYDTAPGPTFPPWWGKPPELKTLLDCRNPGKCLKCHEANSMMDPSHAFGCVQCHRGNSEAEDQAEAHDELIADPGDLVILDKTCGRCHPEEARSVRRSSMALAPRMINHTRFAFGSQQTPEAQYASRETDGLRQVPHPSLLNSLGDDLLRRSCLRCHLFTSGSARWGEHRGRGCSACHVAYPNSSNGKPLPHALVRNLGINPCLKCHNSNHVGADFVGLFEKDFHRGFRSPFVAGRQSPQIYGSEQHRLSQDVHFKAGMGCADCHTLDEIHGTGEVNRSPITSVRISCEGCHVRGDHPAVLRSPSGDLTLLRGDGRKIPGWSPDTIPHSVVSHREKLKCSACHSAWSFQDYGLHLMLEERADYWKWAPNAAQNDPQVQEILRRNLGSSVELVLPESGAREGKSQEQWDPPLTRDWLSGEVRTGAWFRGYTARRWERPPLGVDHLGRVTVMRPIYQYVISHVDREENLRVDRMIPVTGQGFDALIFNPYSPHTIANRGRNCHDCHGCAKAVGLGEGRIGFEKQSFRSLWESEKKIPGHLFVWDALVDMYGKALQRSSIPGAGPLGPAMVTKLMNPSSRHRTMWNRYLRGLGNRSLTDDIGPD